MRLRYTSDAAIELDEVLTGIAEKAPQGAHRVRHRIQGAIARLLDQPRSGSPTSIRTIRRVVVRPYPYIVFYELTEDEVVIIGVRHAARHPASMPDAL